MKTKLKSWILAITFAVTIGGSAFVVLPSTPVSAAGPNCSGVAAFLTFPAWYRGLAVDNGRGGCDICGPAGLNVNKDACSTTTSTSSDNIGPFIWHIVLNVIEIGLQLVGYAAFGFILFAGFQYMTSAGDPAQAVRARQTIFNAAIGIFVSFAAIAVVNLVVGIIPK